MADQDQPPVINNPWSKLRAFTAARIALGRAGSSLPTEPLLAFQLAHAQAQDAVHLPLNVAQLAAELASLGWGEAIALHSQAQDRRHYLQRPDLGRRLEQASSARLRAQVGVDQDASARPEVDLAIAVVDGLSSLAVQSNTLPFLQALKGCLAADAQPWSLAPLTIVEQGRVAIGDEIGELLNARAVVVLVGERPGLSSPDSLGLYYTWRPRPGRTDAERNCISNIRPQGLSYQEAANRLRYLLNESCRLQLSGVNLKDRSDDQVIEHQGGAKNFLLPQ
ncbi:ethanolamine ammonia-lyase subunit EutC [Halioxenophilus sp. WMMB6]|uniref:ethanolamine ammonia-lyase subunit EutC n=1 Tax=Halioxenophilus sp. WMMB6 TaxID=3073815 RepID=UPI00295E420E|nr:ethanolamine ammonia-lyase subunit EutC [Halioxenophilus sp. WMMB6]